MGGIIGTPATRSDCDVKIPAFRRLNPRNSEVSLLPREGEKVARVSATDEGASCRMTAGGGDNCRDAPSSVSFADTFSPSRGRRENWR